MKLLDRVRQAARVKHFSLATERAYVYWAERYIRFHGIKHPDTMGEPEVEAFLTHLAVDGRVSASTQNQALAALLFLYQVVLGRELSRLDAVRAARPVRVPTVLSRDEVHALLVAVDHVSRTEPYGLMARLMYGAGLRLMERSGGAPLRGDPRLIAATPPGSSGLAPAGDRGPAARRPTPG